MTVPSCGASVVNGYGAIFGVARVNLCNNVDLPALGNPINPTSAMRFNSMTKLQITVVS
jgi:hypothetical protein